MRARNEFKLQLLLGGYALQLDDADLRAPKHANAGGPAASTLSAIDAVLGRQHRALL
jgi:hypothetical protein